MKLHDLGAVAAGAVSANPTRPATALVHDSPDARLVVFRIEPGQEVHAHTSRSSVALTVLEGSGFVTGAEGEAPVREGMLVTYAPEELHAMRAGNERLVLLALIAPRP